MRIFHLQLVVAAGNEGFNSMTYEHLDLIQALDMPFFIVVTKIENTPCDATLVKLKSILASVGCRKIPLLIQNEDDVMTAGPREQVVPIFCVSNVNGAGLDLLTRFLFVLSPGISNAEKERLEQLPCEFRVEEIFKLNDTISGDSPTIVVGGLLTFGNFKWLCALTFRSNKKMLFVFVAGVLTENMNMKIGPMNDGSFLPVTVNVSISFSEGI